MNRLRLFCLLAAVAVAATPLLTVATPAVEAQTCWTGYSTGPAASAWGMGSTCNNALGDLQSQLQDQAQAECEAASFLNACNITVVQTSTCYWSASYGKWIIDGYADFGCQGFNPDTRG